MYPAKSIPSRWLAVLLALCLCAAALLSCTPDVPFDTEQPDPTPDTPTDPVETDSVSGETPTETDAPAKKGCRSVLALPAVLLMACGGWMLLRRKEER
jgi:hypothetical protein